MSVREHATDVVAGWVGDADRVVVLTGAGVSTASGIPDYRGPNGVWTRDPDAEKLSTIDYYVADPQVRKEAWRRRLAHEGWSAEPNDGHRAIAELDRAGRLQLLVTQNVDGLHQAAGLDPERIVEIHGTIHEVACLDCGDRAPMRDALQRVEAGEEDPHCRACGGLLKSATISFGQALVEADLARAIAAAGTCDLFLAAGTSLQVYPVAGLPQVALRSGARLVIANAEPTPLDDHAHAVLRGDLTDVLPALVSEAH